MISTGRRLESQQRQKPAFLSVNIICCSHRIPGHGFRRRKKRFPEIASNVTENRPPVTVTEFVERVQPAGGKFVVCSKKYPVKFVTQVTCTEAAPNIDIFNTGPSTTTLLPESTTCPVDESISRAGGLMKWN